MRAFTMFWLAVLVGGLYVGGLRFALAFVLFIGSYRTVRSRKYFFAFVEQSSMAAYLIRRIHTNRPERT